MGDKSTRKKQYIIDKAAAVFMEKGYKTVTMKDIVEACDISRGGLYLYFESTRQLFIEVLKNANEGGEDIFSGKITEESTATEILVVFFLEQKKEILKKNTLAKAAYEFYFEDKPEKKDDLMKQDFDGAVKVLQKIIDVGVENEEFVCDNPYEAARNIMFTIEGFKVTAQTFGVTPEVLDKQFLYILSTLGVENDV